MIAVSPSAEESHFSHRQAAEEHERHPSLQCEACPAFSIASATGRLSSPTVGWARCVSAAVPRLRCPEEANLRAPDTVVSLHLSFINAGAELIETNTFGANRPKLAARYLEDDFAAINEAGVKLARDARQVSGREVFIAGSIGPLGENEEAWPEDRGPAFVEQARLLAGRGVDLFMVETFFDLEELVTAIEAVRSVSDLPVVALLTFGEDAETIGGVGAAQAAERLAALDVAAIGANHGAGPASRADGAPGDGRPAGGRSRRSRTSASPACPADG